MKRSRQRKNTRSKTASKTALAPAPPQGGARLPLGAHPGNTGGKPGRSGRKSDALREQLENLGDESIAVLRQILSGELSYTLTGKCSECGKQSKGPSLREILKLAPAPIVRLKAAEVPLRLTVGRELTVRLVGMDGAQQALHTIVGRIRSRVPKEVADELVQDIQLALKNL